MDDKELLSLLIDDLYEDSGYCYNIIDLLKEKHNVEISLSECYKLYRNIVDLGFAKEGNVGRGPHLCIMLSEKGRELVLEYGSYDNFLNSKRSKAIKQDKESRLRNNEIKIKIVHIIVTIIISIATIAISIYAILQNDKIEKLEELLHKNNIEIPE